MSALLQIPAHWRDIQRRNFIRISDLADFLEWDISKRSILLKNPTFPLSLPRRLAEKIPKNTLHDPLLKQFIPTTQEQNDRPGFIPDPTSDSQFQKEKKFLQKYAGRALLITTSACAMNCRFCFRQNFSYERKRPGYEEELKLIAKDPSLTEIILSGGDPLSLEDRVLGDLMSRLEEIPHLKRIRFHTRFPIGIPERIDRAFLALLGSCKKQVFFVIHANHPAELDEDVFTALKEVQKLAIPVLTHTVLLREINDDFATLKLLFEGLADRGIIPYYLNQLDRVKGASHFEVEEKKGKELIRLLRENLSGYAVPKYVKEVPGEKYKVPLF